MTTENKIKNNKSENKENDLKTDPKSEKIKPSKSILIDLKTATGQLLFLIVIVLASLIVRFIFTETINKYMVPSEPQMKNVTTPRKPVYTTFGELHLTNHLKHVHIVLERLGFQYETNASHLNWDLLWTYTDPYIHSDIPLTNLKPHQRVNHFPGIGFLASKVYVATTELKYIPKAFMLPRDKETFLEYSEANPNKLFVQKNIHHRQIYVRNLEEINFNDNETFIQEYIDNPLLVDGHKFDFGVYVIITSMDPLRLYIYKGDVMFRYCPVAYYPFDPKNLGKYIVEYNYLPTWQMPSLTKYFNDLGFGMKASFDAYMQSREEDTEYIWDQVEDAIRTIVLKKQPDISEFLPYFESGDNFFEMMRFDLIIDSDLRVYLLEANMSPNLASGMHAQNRELFEQVTYNLLNLVGIGSTLKRESLRLRHPFLEDMVSSDVHIVVHPETCGSLICSESCEAECELCLPCLTPDTKKLLHNAYREHMRKGDTKRIFPIPIKNKQLDEEHLATLSPKNQLITKWFYGKCLLDSTWCS